jgi:L-ascorbate metabolism protein UlaG (beta-lactamase superfamily)
MTTALKYLKPNVAFEPLICRWHAWPFLVAPASFAMVVKNRLVPLLESFVEDPEFHRESARDPALRGGSFLDYDGDLALAQGLLDHLHTAVQPQLELADALLAANEVLLREANGTSLEPLYARMPESLQGLIELGYDLNNHATVRVIEPLLYSSKFYVPGHQSVLLHTIGNEERPFVLVTPLIDPSVGVLLDAPFNDPLYDDLARMRERGLPPAEFDRLCLRIGERGADVSKLSALFTEQAPVSRHTPVPEGDVRVRYFGHASLLIEGGGTSILTDPSLGYETGGGEDRYSFQDLPASIDYVLITHNHQDHVIFESLLQLRHKIRHIVVPRSNGGTVQDPSLRLALEAIGFESVIELDEMQTLKVAGGSITGLPFLGEHCDLHIRSKLGFQVELAGQRVMCLADSNNLDPALYRRVGERLPTPDMIFIGMECTGGPMSWLYGDLLPRKLKREHDQSRRLNSSDFERGRRIVDQFDPKAVWVYAMGAEPWFTHISSIVYNERSAPIVESNKLIAHCRAKGMQAERLYAKREIVLSAGEVRVTG